MDLIVVILTHLFLSYQDVVIIFIRNMDTVSSGPEHSPKNKHRCSCTSWLQATSPPPGNLFFSPHKGIELYCFRISSVQSSADSTETSVFIEHRLVEWARQMDISERRSPKPTAVRWQKNQEDQKRSWLKSQSRSGPLSTKSGYLGRRCFLPIERKEHSDTTKNLEKSFSEPLPYILRASVPHEINTYQISVVL